MGLFDKLFGKKTSTTNTMADNTSAVVHEENAAQELDEERERNKHGRVSK